MYVIVESVSVLSRPQSVPPIFPLIHTLCIQPFIRPFRRFLPSRQRSPWSGRVILLLFDRSILSPLTLAFCLLIQSLACLFWCLFFQLHFPFSFRCSGTLWTFAESSSPGFSWHGTKMGLWDEECWFQKQKQKTNAIFYLYLWYETEKEKKSRISMINGMINTCRRGEGSVCVCMRVE